MAKELFNFYVTKKQKEIVKIEAQEKGASISEMLRRIIDYWIDNYLKEEKV